MNFKKLGEKWVALDEKVCENLDLKDTKKFSSLMVETFNALKEEYANEKISKECVTCIAKMWAFGAGAWGDSDGNCAYGPTFEIASWIHYGFKLKLDDDNPFELDSEGMLTLEAINDYRIDPTKFEVPNDYDEFMNAID